MRVVLPDGAQAPFPLSLRRLRPGEDPNCWADAGGAVWPHPDAAKASSAPRTTSEEIEARRFTRATQVQPEAYQGPVFDPADDRYYSDVQELLEETAPAYVWACHVKNLREEKNLVEVVVEWISENYGNEDGDIDLVGYDELHAALLAFAAKQTAEIWYPDYKRAIVFPTRLAHVFETHENCERTNCFICDGGLSVCTICNGAEGSMPTECPGRQMLREEADAVYAGRLDFINGKWEKRDAELRTYREAAEETTGSEGRGA